MKLEITSRYTSVTQAMRQRINSRLRKLFKYDVDIISAHITLNKEGTSFQTEARIKIPNTTLVAKATDENMYHTLNLIGQKLERQMKKQNRKSAARRHYKPKLLEEEAA